MKKTLLFITAISFLMNAESQITINLTPDKDNSIYSESNNSNGTGALYSGETCSGNSRRALLHFDVAGSLPAGATITAVTLTLNVQQISGSATTNNYNLHPVTVDWGEGTSFGTGTGGPAVSPDATWNAAMFGSTLWTTPGGDFSGSVATTSLTPTLGNFNWTSAGMLTNVQNWYTTPASNFGWILIGDELSNCSAREFGSSETGTAPMLSITYSCSTTPTATCQNAVAYLGSNGLYTLDPAELDGGSIANCGGTLSFSSTETLFDCSDISLSSTTLVITAVYDGNLTGGLPKGVEVFAATDIPDLSIYGLGSATNGGGTDGEEFTFPAVSVSAGTYIYVASETPGFSAFFEFDPDYTSAAMSINGDDAIELFENGVVIDVFGDINVDGTGQPWEYSDGWAYRVTNTGPDGTTFTPANWTFSGINALDPALTNATAPVPVPIGTYLTSAFIPVTLTVTDEFSNMSTCNAGVIVFDTLGPNMACIGPAPFTLDGTGNLTLGIVDIDNGTTDGCGIMSLILSQTTFDCSDLGVNAITLTGTDIYGNTSECVANILIEQGPGGLTITEDGSSDITCAGDMDGSISVTISGGNPAYIIDWDNDGTGDNDDTDDLSGLDGGTYTLTVTDQSNCTAQLVVVLSEPGPILATISTDNISCPGETDGAVDLSVTGGTGAYTFDWDNDGTGDNDDTEDLTGLNFGDYEVVITDANGCFATFNTTVLNAVPVDVSVTQTGFTLTANATGVNYQWIICPANTTVSGATSAVFNPAADGDYAVIISDGNGCEDTSACYTIFGLSTDEFNTPEILVYPNPASDFVTVRLTENNSNTLLSVTDVNGRTVITKNVVNQTEVLDLSNLETGVYFLTIFSTDTAHVVKLKVIR